MTNDERAMNENPRGSADDFGKFLRIAAWSCAAILFALPLVAMQFTDQVHWTLLDFVVAAFLISLPTLAFDLAVRKSDALLYRTGVALALGGAFLLAWLSIGVGIIGTKDGAPANLMYFGVILIGIVGSAAAGFRPSGIARALFAASLAQGVVTAIAIIGELGYPAAGLPAFLGINGFFVVLFLIAALLLMKSANR